MKSRLVRAIIISTILITATSARGIFHQRVKRGHAENTFKALLNIYKMNPLKRSKVYTTFSNQVLLNRPDTKRVVMNFDSNESTRFKEKKTGAKLRQIESIIQHSQEGTTINYKRFNVESATHENLKSSLKNDFFKIKPYDIEDEIIQNEGNVVVDNAHENIFPDAPRYNIYAVHSSSRKQLYETKTVSKFVRRDFFNNTDSETSYDKSVLVLR